MNSTDTLPTLPNPLFHGSAVLFNRIDVSKGWVHKDFGKGFYLALSAGQAIGMMHKKYHEAVSRRRVANWLVKNFEPVDWRAYA